MRRALACVALLAGLLPGGAEADSHTIEAESGEVTYPTCGDDPPMRTLDNTHASGGKTAFYPGDGCAMTYSAGNGRYRVTSIRFYLTGADGPLCGRFLLTGGVVGTTRLFCVDGAAWTTEPVYGTTRVGPYAVAWLTGPGTPKFVNAFVDYHTGTT